jgi:hypothetical protein
MSYEAPTPWGPEVNRETCIREHRIITVYMPWHKGRLGAITVQNGSTTFVLNRGQLKPFIENQEKLGANVVIRQLKYGEKAAVE